MPIKPSTLSLIRHLLLTILTAVYGLTAHANIDTALQNMDDSNNPLMLMKTSRGDVFLELFQDAAPNNVANFIGLAEAEVPLLNPTTGETVYANYYDGLTFHRVLSGYLVQAGRQTHPERGLPARQLADEINASQLGLNQIKVLDIGLKPHPWLNIADKLEFEQQVLAPLYGRLNINNLVELSAREQEVMTQLRNLSLQQAFENLGYRFNNNLPSRRPVRGSLILANSGPNTNSAEFFIPILDAPWLTGTHTVIGKVVAGMEVVDRIHIQSAGRLASPLATTTIYEIRRVDPRIAVSGQ